MFYYLANMLNNYKQVKWIGKTNVYEVNLRQYTEEGTIRAFQEKHLDRLHQMGIDVLWFMPITPISEKGKKGTLGSYYACSSYTKINAEFGNFVDFNILVQHAHDLGMKVIIDWVANHTGCDHEWTELYPDFYKRNEAGECYDAHGWDDVIDLDYNNASLREEMIKSMRFWIESCNIDGFRCDMAMLTPQDFWHQARTGLLDCKELLWLAELDPLDNPDYMEVFDSAYTWRWMNDTKHFRNQGAREIYHLKYILDLYKQSFPSNVYPAWFTSNHDENSWNGTEYEKYGEMAIPLAVFSTMWKGIPLIYSGQELPNVKRLAFFDKDIIAWSAIPVLHGFYKKLLSFRKTNQVFQGNANDSLCFFTNNNVDHHVLSFERKFNNQSILVVINFSEYPLHNVQIETVGLLGVYTELFSASTQVFNGGHQYFHFQPWGYQIWYQ